MDKKNITREEAVLALLYDDFIGDLFRRGKQGVATFWKENRETIFDLLRGAATTILPKMLAIGGDRLKSSDPYAIDTDYVRTLFSLLVSSPMPRELFDPLAFLTRRT